MSSKEVKCDWCGAPTQLYHCGVPICLRCSDERDAMKKRPASERPEKREKSA